jgi:hypothetical protein
MPWFSHNNVEALPKIYFISHVPSLLFLDVQIVDLGCRLYIVMTVPRYMKPEALLARLKSDFGKLLQTQVWGGGRGQLLYLG